MGWNVQITLNPNAAEGSDVFGAEASSDPTPDTEVPGGLWLYSADDDDEDVFLDPALVVASPSQA